MRKLLIATLLTVATTAHAANFTTQSGTLATVSSITTSDTIQTERASALVIGLGGTLGTTAAICQQSVDKTNWTTAPGASSVSALGVACHISNPAGYYRVSVTTCTGCTLTITYTQTRLQ